MRQGDHFHLPLLIGGGLLLIILVVYGQALAFEFVRFDDPGYVTDNAHVKAGLSAQSIKWAFTTSAMGNWHPLTWLSLMFDSEVGGGSSTFHLTSLVLHTVNALLLFYLLLRMTRHRWSAAFVAAMFAVHPLHVESVAWVSERKDVLSALFCFLTVLAYVRYVERPLLRRYLPVLLAFALGLMSKPMLVTLPVLLLLLDYWPLQRYGRGSGLRKLLWEKTPLFLLAAASSVVTLYAQSAAGALAAVESFPLGLRGSNALVSYTRYLFKTCWPSGLALPYPYDLEILTPLRVVASALLLGGVSLLVLRRARRRPYLIVGWSWYLITLVPVSGLVQVGSQAMADRYTYLPIIGLFIMVAWGATDLVTVDGRPGRGRKALLATAAGAATLAVMTTAHVQAGHWRNTTALFTHVLEVTERNAVAHDLLGLEWLEAGGLDQALAHLDEAVRIAPDYLDARANLAAALSRAGRHEEAVDQRREVLRRRPRDPDAHAHLGLALGRLGRHEEALASLAEALRLAPDNPVALRGSGVALTRQGKNEQAIAYLRRALRVDPGDAETHVNLGTVFLRQDELERAEAEFEEALRIDPDNASAHKNLGVLLARQRKLGEAMAHFAEVLRVDPRDEAARKNLERARSMLEGAPVK